MEIYVYETDDDAINAVVMDGDVVINVVSGAYAASPDHLDRRN